MSAVIAEYEKENKVFGLKRIERQPLGLKDGDIVALKCGGPKMVIDHIVIVGTTIFVWCVWFDAKGKHHIDSFSPQVLEADDRSA
jgi:uncharacterized protein YodC (DUF2158 family)